MLQKLLMKKIRYVNDNVSQNVGFSETEIELLKKQLDFKLPEIYSNFLKVAGKKSNTFKIELNDITDLIKYQSLLKLKIANSDIESFCDQFWCFLIIDNNYFYFEINNGKNPIVYQFSDISYPIDNGWNSKVGIISKKFNFIDFINFKTDEKYGITFWKKVKSYLLLIVFSPVILPTLLFLEIGKKIK